MRSLVFARVLAVVCALVAPRSFAKDLSAEDLRTLQSKLKSGDFLAVDFQQTKTTPMRGKKTKRDGKAIFAKPDKFKWMLETPKQEYKIYDGKDFYDYEPSTKSAVRFSATGPNAYELKQIVDLVLNFDTLLKRYDVVKADEDKGIVSVTLKPKVENEITGVGLKLDLKDSFISYLKFELRDKTVLEHEFKNPVRKPVGDDAFALPKGVKVTETN